MAHPNAELVRRGFEAFAAGDVATLDQLIADDAKWHTPGRNPLAGDFDGKAAILESFARIRAETDSFNQDVHAILADDDHVVALVNATITRGGKTLEVQQTLVFHIADGKATEVWAFPTDQYAVDEFWAN
ncbi:MAG TPA: nuclear transport factor 2 family protein [Actinomycetota bacterium]|jgi:ketosteroid isomerase-like protein|nr:nuclear transport factor 2 family protein [Actinomycetota bacterium]